MVNYRRFLALGSFVLVAILFGMHWEKWTLMESLYWYHPIPLPLKSSFRPISSLFIFLSVRCIVTITTVGYGDYSPVNTEPFQVFGIFFILVGILSIFDIITSIFEEYVEASQAEAVAAADSKDEKDDEQDDGSLRSYPFKSALILLVVLAFGTSFFSTNEDWPVIDAFCKLNIFCARATHCLRPTPLYLDWCVCTATTVGYGDMSLEQETSRTFSIFFVLASVIAFGNLVGEMGDIKMKASMKKQRDKIKNMKITHADLMAMDDHDGLPDTRDRLPDGTPNSNKGLPMPIEVDCTCTTTKSVASLH
jgi:hypothetical protein